MPGIEDFTRTQGWTFTCGKPSTTYPAGHILIITRSKTPELKVDLTWIDSGPHFDQLLGVPFDEENGRIHGQTSDKTLTVTVTLTADCRLDGRVEGDGLPEPGTWGADANGGWEKKP